MFLNPSIIPQSFFPEILSYFVSTAPVLFYFVFPCILSCVFLYLTHKSASSWNTGTLPPYLKHFCIPTSILRGSLQTHSINECGIEIPWSLLLLIVTYKVYHFLEVVFVKWNESSEGQAISMWYFVSKLKQEALRKQELRVGDKQD